jgi:hypothetical protein
MAVSNAPAELIDAAVRLLRQFGAPSSRDATRIRTS